LLRIKLHATLKIHRFIYNIKPPLFRFLDHPDFSPPVLHAIHECLRKGMTVLLPPLNERVKKARELLVKDQEVGRFNYPKMFFNTLHLFSHCKPSFKLQHCNI
jgi:hypothetical protein